MALRLALAGDTMLGRSVAERLRSEPPAALFSPDVIEAARDADLFVLNLAASPSGGERWVLTSRRIGAATDAGCG